MKGGAVKQSFDLINEIKINESIFKKILTCNA